MLNICHTYSTTWQYRFNSSKCSIIVIGRFIPREPSFSWSIGTNPIQIALSHLHLGVPVSNRMNNGERVAKACEKGRSVIHAVLGINAKSTSMNALVEVNIYRKVVIPSILFGCEHWSQINQADIRNLNTFQHYADKFILNVGKRTRSDIAESILGIQRIGATIDQRKLIFLAQLINLDCRYIVKKCS
ncbi:hypothetical protein KP79_PYT21619 [Mizuhopecten yessoensis]|uniref:Uncharacterized protein n=1 Tax=Mizuhopecten yessoensis TaxID=6573 RepID=A0A210R0B3_MIZYE|nr:hypothetical protein KP79_PYT21619 [Mizuhopecten yessoensis]